MYNPHLNGLKKTMLQNVSLDKSIIQENRSLVIPKVKEVELPEASSYTFPIAFNEARFRNEKSNTWEKRWSSQLHIKSDLNSQVCSLPSKYKNV